MLSISQKSIFGFAAVYKSSGGLAGLILLVLISILLLIIGL